MTSQSSQQSESLDDQQRGLRVEVLVHWSPPLTVLSDVSSDEVVALQEELRRLSLEAVRQLTREYQSDASGFRYSITKDFIGPHAQAVEALRIVLENLPTELAYSLVDDLARYAASGIAETAIGKLQALRRQAGRQSVSPTVAVKPDHGIDYFPEDHEIFRSHLLYATLDPPPEMEIGSEDWERVVQAGSQLEQWYRESLTEAMREVQIPSSLAQSIVVRKEVRPPFADPLIPAFFANLDPLVAGLLIGVGSNLATDVGKAVVRSTWNGLKRRVQNHGLPEDALRVTASKIEMESLCEALVRQVGHPRAHLLIETFGYNRQYESGYVYPLDPQSPMGWDVEVKLYAGSWIFRVLDDLRNVRVTHRRGGTTIYEKYVDLIDG